MIYEAQSGEKAMKTNVESRKCGCRYQKAGAFEMQYDDMTLLIDPVLVDIYPAGEPVLGDVAPKPVPLNRFEERAKP